MLFPQRLMLYGTLSSRRSDLLSTIIDRRVLRFCYYCAVHGRGFMLARDVPRILVRALHAVQGLEAGASAIASAFASVCRLIEEQ